MKWKFQTGNGATLAGNDEAEVYCAYGSDAAPCKANQPNAFLDGKGHLILVARRTDQTVTVGAKRITSPVYTSARLASLRSFRYGRLEASMRLPKAEKGVWPAFWALGDQTASVHWPATGEIDVMEQWNPQPGAPDRIDPLTIHGSVHGPKQPGSSEGYIDQIGNYVFSEAPSSALHQYAVEWGPGEVDFYVDGNLFSRQSVGTMTGNEVWEEDRGPFFLLLNLAMGGGFFGYPDAATSPTPVTVLDYVRVYQRADGALASGWGNYDVGGPAQAGSSSFSNGVYTVAGGGLGIAGHSDQFQFAYKSMGGDGEVTAHVLTQTGKNAQAKAGVMLRDGRGSAAPFAAVFVSPDGAVHFRLRDTQGAVPSEVLSKAPATWVKIGRVGEVFTGYASADGKQWTPIGGARLSMPRDLTAGLIASSREDVTPNVARFDYVGITQTDAAYDGQAVTLPGAVQAERFDTGGKGYSYSPEFGDTGPTVDRIADSAGSEQSAGGLYLSGLKANRYLNYSVTVAKDGEYRFVIRAASAGSGGSLHFNLDQKPLSKPILLPDTGGPAKWSDVMGPTVHLAAGQHTIALVTDSEGPSGAVANIDLFNVRPH